MLHKGAEHYENAAHHHREAPNTTKPAITRKQPITPTWLTAMPSTPLSMPKLRPSTTWSSTHNQHHRFRAGRTCPKWLSNLGNAGSSAKLHVSEDADPAPNAPNA